MLRLYLFSIKNKRHLLVQNKEDIENQYIHYLHNTVCPRCMSI